jgi:two-component system, cell cycle sensor histidine kinase and response regulator CckA
VERLRAPASPILGKPKAEKTRFRVPSGIGSEQSNSMSALTEINWSWKDPKEPLRSYFEQAPVGLAECRYAGTIKSFNPALVRLLGAPLDLRRPVTLAGLIDAENRDEAEHQLADLFEGRRQSVQIDSQATCRERVCLRWTAWRVPGNHGDSGSVLAMAEELPRDAALGRQFEQVAKLESLGKLAGGVAHDFNNILTGILLYCDLLMASLDPGHRARKYAEEIRTAGMQASGLVRQLLAITCHSTFQPRPLSLNEIAAAMRNLLMRLVGENIQLNFRLDPKLGLTKMDPTQAQQILLNLVLNARDAMPKGGRIVVETRNCRLQPFMESRLSGSDEASLPCALFAIEDNGSGMDAATRAHIFEPFFTTKQGKGTGLGLATVHDIVSSSGGLIHVSSEPGQGTRVSVFLPLLPGTEPEPASGNDFSPRSDGEVLSSQEEE